MNSETGEVKQFADMKDAIKAGFCVSVSMAEMTKAQSKRLFENDQPVVKLADKKSQLGKKRLKDLSLTPMHECLIDVLIGDRIKFSGGVYVRIESIGSTAMLVKAIGKKKIKETSGEIVVINGAKFQVLALGKYTKLNFLGLISNEKENVK